MPSNAYSNEETFLFSLKRKDWRCCKEDWERRNYPPAVARAVWSDRCWLRARCRFRVQGRAASTSAKFCTASYLTKDTSRRNLWLRIDVCVGIVVLRNS
jgi:hypothetical protein